MSNKTWTQEQINWLTNNSITHTVTECAIHLQRTYKSIYNKGSSLNLSFKRESNGFPIEKVKLLFEDANIIPVDINTYVNMNIEMDFKCKHCGSIFADKPSLIVRRITAPYCPKCRNNFKLSYKSLDSRPIDTASASEAFFGYCCTLQNWIVIWPFDKSSQLQYDCITDTKKRLYRVQVKTISNNRFPTVTRHNNKREILNKTHCDIIAGVNHQTHDVYIIPVEMIDKTDICITTYGEYCNAWHLLNGDDLKVNLSQSETKTSLISIGQASKITGYHQNSLRRWEEQGKLVPQRTPGGHRRYILQDILDLTEEK